MMHTLSSVLSSVRSGRQQRMSVGVLAALIAVVAAACTPPAADPPDGSDGPPVASVSWNSPVFAAASSLVEPYDSCGPLLDDVQQQALDRVTANGLTLPRWYAQGDVVTMEESANQLAADGAAAPTRAPSELSTSVDGFSSTNVQVAGVDEPDDVKLWEDDGGVHAVVRAANTLHVTSDLQQATDTQHQGSVQLPDGLQVDGMMLADDNNSVVVTATRHGRTAEAGAAPQDDEVQLVPTFNQYQVTVLLRVDLTDLTNPEVVETTEVDGRMLGARRNGGTLMVTAAAAPANLPFVRPARGGLRGEQAALEQNRQVIKDSTIADWLPYLQHDGPDENLSSVAVDCTNVAAPSSFAGFGTVSVYTFDVNKPLVPTQAGSLMADAYGSQFNGTTVYADSNKLVVSTVDRTHLSSQRAQDGTLEQGPTTLLHQFDVTDGTVAYEASGAVDGVLLNQFAVDHDGDHLRVATTEQPQWGWWNTEQSVSTVSVLQQDGQQLNTVGAVSGLGEGERIYAVRFLGDMGYVVTFRQVDPLYTIDLSDPTDPSVEGELKIPGYSAYLHPAGDGLLFGIGQDGTDDGRLLGTAVQLFDVSDPADPQRVAKETLGHGNSPAEFDHHAATFAHAEDGSLLAVVPATTWGQQPPVEPLPEPQPDAPEVDPDEDGRRPPQPDVVAPPMSQQSGAHVWRITTGGEMEKVGVATLSGQNQKWLAPHRTRIVGSTLWTVTAQGMTAFNLGNLDAGPVTTVEFRSR